MANNLSLNIAKEQMLNELKNSFKVVNDIDVNENVNAFCDKGWYDETKSYNENLKYCIQYMAIKKSKKR